MNNFDFENYMKMAEEHITNNKPQFAGIGDANFIANVLLTISDYYPEMSNFFFDFAEYDSEKNCYVLSKEDIIPVILDFIDEEMEERDYMDDEDKEFYTDICCDYFEEKYYSLEDWMNDLMVFRYVTAYILYKIKSEK